MKILSLLLVAGVIALSVVGCGGASIATGCKQHCEACGESLPCCNDNCLSTIGGPKCVDFVGEICN